MAAVSIQPIARRTTTASILLIIDKVLGRETLGIHPVITPLVFSESNFIPIVVRKGRIALTMAAVSNVGIDAVLLSVSNRGAAVIAGIGRHFRLLKHVGEIFVALSPSRVLSSMG